MINSILFFVAVIGIAAKLTNPKMGKIWVKGKRKTIISYTPLFSEYKRKYFKIPF